MSSDWEKVKLSDLIEVKHGFAYKGKHFSDNPTKEILVTPGNFQIGGGFKKDKLKFYDGPIEEDYILQAGDLIVTMTDLSKKADTLGYSALVPLDENTYHHNQRIGLVLIKDSEKIDKHFLYFLFRSPKYRHHVVSRATGSTVKHSSPSKICSFEFDLPPIEVQKNIASQLMNIELKLNLNQQTNETLEAMAQAIFKSWFVDFEPVRAKIEAKSAGRDSNRAAMAAIAGISPEQDWDEIEAALDQKLARMTEAQQQQLFRTAELFPEELVESEIGLVPKGWELRNINELADIIYGAPFSSKKFNSEQKGYPLIRIRDLKTFEPDNWTEEVHRKGSKVYPGDLLVGMDGEFRATYWFGIESWLNQRVLKISPRGNTPLVFLKMSIEPHLDFFERSKVGTTVIHLGKRDVDSIEILSPKGELLQILDSVLEPTLDKMVLNAAESRYLSDLRDTLLPKLLSGEVGV